MTVTATTSSFPRLTGDLTAVLTALCVPTSSTQHRRAAPGCRMFPQVVDAGNPSCIVAGPAEPLVLHQAASEKSPRTAS